MYYMIQGLLFPQIINFDSKHNYFCREVTHIVIDSSFYVGNNCDIKYHSSHICYCRLHPHIWNLITFLE